MGTLTSSGILTSTLVHGSTEYQAQPCVVAQTHLGQEDHGMFTAGLQLEGKGWGQSAGLYSLDSYDSKRERRVGTAFGMDQIQAILAVCGAEKWESLRGTHLLALRNVETSGNLVLGIASPDGERVLIFSEHAEEWR